MRRLWILSVLLIVLPGCGRYFAGPLRPTTEQTTSMTVNDDGSVTYAQDRLEVTLRPMTDPELNRQFPNFSSAGAASTNPYTFGDWTPQGDEWTPPRFTVFRLSVSNYQFPKVVLDPMRLDIATTNNRQYQAMDYGALYEYYQAYWLGRTGEGREEFAARTDLLRRTMFTDDPVFSGQESEGYVVFPLLHDDVTEITVTIEDVILRFNYANQPIESTDISYHFDREVFQGYQPPTQLVGQN